MTQEYDISHWRVLVIDDDEDNAFVVKRMLARLGVGEIVTIDNGEEGLHLVEAFNPSFILLDLAMPKMDGYTFKDIIRQNPQTTDLIIIAITAHISPMKKDELLQQGFDGCLIKPFKVNTLVSQIVNYLPTELVKLKE
jgi:CheY-like chemotaxis protein